MPDVTHKRIDELDAIQGFLEGFTFRRAGIELGVTPFGVSIVDMPPETTAYPAHDHSSEGPGNPPAHQLGQEEVYIALRGTADVEVDGHRYPLDAGHIIRVGPTARRKILPGPDGVRLLAIGGIPGQAYDPLHGLRCGGWRGRSRPSRRWTGGFARDRRRVRQTTDELSPKRWSAPGDSRRSLSRNSVVTPVAQVDRTGGRC
jgi:mannose-6-phosphate isomerase-like protein (cupin superfamily)